MRNAFIYINEICVTTKEAKNKHLLVFYSFLKDEIIQIDTENGFRQEQINYDEYKEIVTNKKYDLKKRVILK